MSDTLKSAKRGATSPLNAAAGPPAAAGGISPGRARPGIARQTLVLPSVRPALTGRMVTCILGVLTGIAVSWQVLREPGVVGFVHDWSIGPFAEQHLTLLRQTFDGWYRWGLGSPVAYPLEYPLRLALGVVAALGIGGDVMSKAFVVLVIGTSAGALIHQLAT